MRSNGTTGHHPVMIRRSIAISIAAASGILGAAAFIRSRTATPVGKLSAEVGTIIEAAREQILKASGRVSGELKETGGRQGRVAARITILTREMSNRMKEMENEYKSRAAGIETEENERMRKPDDKESRRNQLPEISRPE